VYLIIYFFEQRNPQRFTFSQKTEIEFLFDFLPIPMSFENRTEFAASGGSRHSVGGKFVAFLKCIDSANTMEIYQHLAFMKPFPPDYVGCPGVSHKFH